MIHNNQFFMHEKAVLANECEDSLKGYKRKAEVRNDAEGYFFCIKMLNSIREDYSICYPNVFSNR